MKKLAILGLGHIGKFVYETLQKDTTLKVSGHDLNNGYDLKNDNVLETIISECDGVLASTPFFLNKKIADYCYKHGKDYFDLTESVEVTNYVKKLSDNKNCKSRFVTQCGLAPGMVSIIANDLAKKFNHLYDINIRVGALPKSANNNMQYYRTWNTEGLINEYINPCPAIQNGQLVYLEPLEDRENVSIQGITLEAANTSGGLGSLAESFISKAQNVNYKTLRYPGHWDLMKFLKQDLDLKNNFDTFVNIFNTSIPKTSNDCVYIYISVSGLIDGVKCIKQYTKIINRNDIGTAIQLSTAGGVMAVIDSWNNGYLEKYYGWIKQEELHFKSIYNSKYALCYR